MRVTAARAEGDQTADKHRIEDVQYQLTQRRGNGGAERIDLDGAKGSLIGSTYSTCAPDAARLGAARAAASTSTPTKAWAWRATPPSASARCR